MNPDQRSLDGGEAPLAIARRHAKPCGGSANSLDANLTAEGVEVLGVEPGDLLLVEVFGDRVVFRPHPATGGAANE
jgi:hypothetical protein